MGKILRFLGGAAVGAALGAAAAVLFAPQSGKDLQRSVSVRRGNAATAMKNASARRERELKAEWQAKIDAQAIKREALHG